MTARNFRRPLTGAFAIGLSFAIASCGGMPTNRSVYSVNQPVVERSSVALDVTTSPTGLPVAEQRRISAWFDAMDLRYGDKVSVEDPLIREDVRGAVADIAGKRGLLLSEPNPVPGGDLQPGQARVVLVRSRASVPGCPNWTGTSDATFGNGLSAGYGCANNGNLAAMVANPEDLIKGQRGSSDTYISTSSTTINAYKTQVGTKVNQATVGTGGN